MTSMVPDDAPRPRFCHVRKWDDFNGYGFNLHAEKGKAGQFIGKVDPASPADFAGLKEGDRIVEINGTNISNENHQQVVQRVKAVPNETKMLVLDQETEEYYRNLKIVVRGDMPNVESHSAPERNPASHGDGVADNVSNKSSNYDGDADSRKSSPEVQRRSEDAPAENVDNVEQVLDALDKVGDDHDTDHPHRGRLCHIKIWPEFQGYGFNLHAEKNKTGQFIGKVDPGSPAEAAGLRQGDRIIAVNGKNVTGENHQSVVATIKTVANETKLLVLDPTADDYFHDKGIVVDEDSPFVDLRVSPSSKPVVIEAVSAVQEAVEETMSHPYKARFVHLATWSDYNGYGFNMHSIKGKDGEFIGKVETGSPAYVAGLKEGDRIIEVGETNIENSSHHDVVQKIKVSNGRATMLVVDAEADAHFKSKNIAVNSRMSALSLLTCPDTKPQVNGTSDGFGSQGSPPPPYESCASDNQNSILYDEAPVVAASAVTPTRDEVSLEAEKIADSIMASVLEAERSLDAKEEISESAEDEQDLNDYEDVNVPSPTFAIQNNNEEIKDPVIQDTTPEPEPQFEPVSEPEHEFQSYAEPEPANNFDTSYTEENNFGEAQRPAEAVSPPSPSPVTIAGLEFAGSVEEARRRMSGHKKREVRATTSSLSAKQKYDLFQRL